MMKNWSIFILQTSRLLTNYGVRHLPKVRLERCISFDSRKYVNDGISKRECSHDSFEEYDFDLDERVTDDPIENLCRGDAKKLAILKSTRLLISLLRQKGQEIPQKISEKQWLRLLSYEKQSEQIHYLSNLFNREKIRKATKVLSEAEKIHYQKIKEKELEKGPITITTSGPILYRLGYNSIFHRIRDQAFDRFYNYRLLQAMMFAPTVIVDCGFESSMSSKEIDKVAARMIRMWSHNRSHVSPFHILFCNLNLEGRIMQRFQEHLPFKEDSTFPFFYTSKSYTELYSKEKLVYLSSDAHHDLNEFNVDDIYIIGGLSTSVKNSPLARTKARKGGIRTVKFPMKQYNVKMNQTQHPFDLLLVLPILNDLKETKDWNYAFRHISGRQYQIIDCHAKKIAPDHNLKSRERLGQAYNMLLATSRKSAED